MNEMLTLCQLKAEKKDTTDYVKEHCLLRSGKADGTNGSARKSGQNSRNFGREKTISKLLKEYYAPYCDEIIYDNLGSIYGVIKSEKENPTTVLVTAHMDELGFIVKKIEETGLIRGLIMGKIEPNSLLGQEVHLYNRQGKAFPGVILGRKTKQNQVQGKEDVLLDFGFFFKKRKHCQKKFLWEIW